MCDYPGRLISIVYWPVILLGVIYLNLTNFVRFFGFPHIVKIWFKIYELCTWFCIVHEVEFRPLDQWIFAEELKLLACLSSSCLRTMSTASFMSSIPLKLVDLISHKFNLMCKTKSCANFVYFKTKLSKWVQNQNKCTKFIYLKTLVF